MPLMVESRVTDPPLQLATVAEAFVPNPVTVRFARAVRVKAGDVVFDIGTGIGPLAIKAALDGAEHVHAVDPVEAHCRMAQQNAASYGVSERVSVHRGSLFEPLEGLTADVIIGDVSGIADPVAHALGWYSIDVPTGGDDGTGPLVNLLRAAPRFLRPGGTLYFPVALDLSDAPKIMAEARRAFTVVAEAFERPWFEFPLSEAEVGAIHAAYPAGLPSFLTVHSGRRAFWRGQIYQARM